MTLAPDQQRLADAWLAECWRPVREYHAEMEPDVPVEVERKKRCPHCGHVYSRAYLTQHVRRVHQHGQAA